MEPLDNEDHGELKYGSSKERVNMRFKDVVAGTDVDPLKLESI
jgi:hypothetical protein